MELIFAALLSASVAAPTPPYTPLIRVLTKIAPLSTLLKLPLLRILLRLGNRRCSADMGGKLPNE
jgi:hypothetical protein